MPKFSIHGSNIGPLPVIRRQMSPPQLGALVGPTPNTRAQRVLRAFRLARAWRGQAGQAEQSSNVSAQYGVLLGRGEKRAVRPHVVDALAIRAETLDIRHIRTP